MHRLQLSQSGGRSTRTHPARSASCRPVPTTMRSNDDGSIGTAPSSMEPSTELQRRPAAEAAADALHSRDGQRFSTKCVSAAYVYLLASACGCLQNLKGVRGSKPRCAELQSCRASHASKLPYFSWTLVDFRKLQMSEGCNSPII